MNQSLFALLAATSLWCAAGCRKDNSFHEEAEMLTVHERDAEYSQKVHDLATVRPAVALEAGPDYIDVRAVGDSAWTGFRTPQASPSEFQLALSKFDPQKKVLKGDLNFIHWESGVAKVCERYSDSDSGFLTAPAAIGEAFDFGFNLFGLANNHSEDCALSKDPNNQSVSGAVATSRYMKQIAEQKNVLWHGVGPSETLQTPNVQTFSIKGRLIKVVFAAVSLQEKECVESACRNHVTALLNQMRTIAGDVRILSIHTQGIEAFEEGKNLAERFVREYSGDIVFATGPHTWAGIKVIDRAAGGRGVVFHGLGNFLHNQVAANPNNMIGRVLLDVKTLQPKQVQVIPILNNVFDVDVTFAEPGKGLPKANLEWTRAHLPAHRDIPIGFANIK